MLEGLKLCEKGKSCKIFLLLLFLQLKIDSFSLLVFRGGKVALSETFGRTFTCLKWKQLKYLLNPYQAGACNISCSSLKIISRAVVEWKCQEENSSDDEFQRLNCLNYKFRYARLMRDYTIHKTFGYATKIILIFCLLTSYYVEVKIKMWNYS
jgi:hypothetical protein